MKKFLIVSSICLISNSSFALPQCPKVLKSIIDNSREEAKLSSVKVKHSNLDLLTFFGTSIEKIPVDNIKSTEVSSVINFLRENLNKEYKKGSDEIVKFYIEFSKSTGVTPSVEEMNRLFIDAGLHIDIKKLIGEGLVFENMKELHTRAVERSPIVKKALNSNLSSREIRMALRKAVMKSKGIFITAAVNGAPVNEKAFQALINMAKEKDAIIIIKPVNHETDALSPRLFEMAAENPGRVFVSIDETQFNQWWNLNDIKVTAKQINSLMGLQRLWERGTSQIIATPKFHMDTVATKDNENVPHRLYTTGAITEPNYSGKKYIQGRTDEIAKDDHVIGALYLEKTQFTGQTFDLDVAGNFHPRYVEFIPEKDGFVDLGKLYTGSSVTKAGVEALVLGDIHVQNTDQKLLVAIKEQILKLKPKYIILHDLMNGTSVNPHEKGRKASLAAKAADGKLDIARELSEVANFVNALTEIDPSLKVVIIRSNHNDWLDRWVESEDYLQQPQNYGIAKELGLVASRGEDPFIYALMNGVGGSVKINKQKRVIFPVDATFKVGPNHRLVELGEHGDKGANGAKGSINSFIRGTDRAVFGHTHRNEIRNGVVNIATSTPKVVEYTKGGFSNWAQSLAVVGENGDIQVLTFELGELRAPDNFKPNSNFFMDGFPTVYPTINPSVDQTGQIDQYSIRK